MRTSPTAGRLDRPASEGSPRCSRVRRVTPVRDVAAFSGTAHPALAAEICGHLGVPLLPARVSRFANDCLEEQLQANCRERDVFLIQPLVAPVQEHLVELLLMLDAARGGPVVGILDRRREREVRSVRVVCTHGLFADGALERISARDDVLEIVCTNTVPTPPGGAGGKLTVLSVATALAEAMRRIHDGESVSALFT